MKSQKKSQTGGKCHIILNSGVMFNFLKAGGI